MCMSCGCGMPNDNHGDERDITQDDLDRAAAAADISREQSGENIMSCCQQGATGQQEKAGQERSTSSGTATG